MTFIFRSNILGRIIPADELIFLRWVGNGRYTTNQYIMLYPLSMPLLEQSWKNTPFLAIEIPTFASHFILDAPNLRLGLSSNDTMLGKRKRQTYDSSMATNNQQFGYHSLNPDLGGIDRTGWNKQVHEPSLLMVLQPFHSFHKNQNASINGC